MSSSFPFPSHTEISSSSAFGLVIEISDAVEISVFRGTEEIPGKTPPVWPDTRAGRWEEDHGDQPVSTRPGPGDAVRADSGTAVDTAPDSAADATRTTHRDD